MNCLRHEEVEETPRTFVVVVVDDVFPLTLGTAGKGCSNEASEKARLLFDPCLASASVVGWSVSGESPGPSAKDRDSSVILRRG